ncbi:protein BIG GRAIN 1-like E [Primulina eburnea]|uniref:protein BIG GRAIN 1-like E n=1 Tax=Primulina eburnea TaxID=1245227 RepID=UPI003C6C82D3
MSVTGHSVPSGFEKISLQWRNYSGELDVFEATQYFSGANEVPGYISPNLGQNPIKTVRRMSLDLPKSNIISAQINQIPEKQILKDNKKYKQPSSPGARIASFLNSLFNQKSVKKKKLISGRTNNDPEVENPGEQRRRRSGISHFPVTNSAADSKSIYSTSSSGFTTPHVYANTPTKLYKEFRSFSDPLQHVSSGPKSSENFKPGSLKNGEYDVKTNTDYAWSDEKLISFRNGSSAKVIRNGSSEFADQKKCSTNYWVENYPPEVQEFRKFSHGGDSDSSSDLFDLPNYDLDICSSTGLPVYETTQMDMVKKSVLVSSTATV